MSKLDELKEIIDGMNADYQKFFEKGVNASASRLRKSLQTLRTKAQELRIEIQEEKTRRKAPKSE